MTVIIILDFEGGAGKYAAEWLLGATVIRERWSLEEAVVCPYQQKPHLLR